MTSELQDLVALTPETMSGADIARALPMVLEILHSCDGICDRALALLKDNPDAIPGWRLVAGDDGPALIPLSELEENTT